MNEFKELFEQFEDKCILLDWETDYEDIDNELGKFEYKCSDNTYDFDGRADCWAVWYFPKFDVYVKVEGYYRSWGDGMTYTGYKIVKPITKTITDYE